MATYQYAANSSLVFNPLLDTLNFDTGSASQLVFATAGSDLLVGLGSANMRLLGVGYASLFGSSLVFADLSQFRPGGGAAEFLFGAGGGDYLDAGGGADTLQGEAGNDYLSAGAGDDLVFGGEGQDTLLGGTGRDALIGGLGDDTYLVTAITSHIDDEGGNDSAVVGVSFAKLPSTIENIAYIDGAMALPYWVDALLPDGASGKAFTSLLGDSRILHFSFPGALPGYNGNPDDAVQFTGFNDMQKSFARQALTYISTVIDVQFVETTNANAVNTIAFGNNDQPDSVAYAYFPSESFVGSDVFLDLDTPGNLVPADGEYSALTLIHELGHALGLEHPFALASDWPDLPASEAITRWTVMSYTDDPAQYHLAYSPLDLAALHYLYGPSPGARAGNDSYALTASDANFIWDGAGHDTLDGGALTQDATLYLEPGYWGFIGSKADLISAPGQVTVNFGSAIEGLMGGLGNDDLHGNTLANTIAGGAGNDSLDGGTGADRMFGGTGNDTFYVDTQADLVFENVGEGADIVVSSVDFYLYANIEGLTLATGAGNIFGSANALANTVTGNESNNLLLGWDGNDTLSGNAGADILYGAEGSDSLLGGDGVDTLVGGNGNDSLDGGASADAVYGEDGDDVLHGGTGFATDILIAGAGNDTLDGSASLASEQTRNQGDYDIMDGGAGNDTYHVDTPADLIVEDLAGGTDTVVADIHGAGYYLNAHVENLTLAGNTPFGAGNGLANMLTGSALANWLLGGAGNDTLNGGAGNDVLFGEGGADTFVFRRGTGGDVVGDYTPGVDKLDIAGTGYGSFAQVQACMVQNGDSTAIDLGAGDFIVLMGVSLASLAAADVWLA
jgi:Ca2+-binding RTX toxin-like protein